MGEGGELPEASDRRLGRAVAATVVALSVVMALAKIKDDNLVKAMQAAQAERIDTWNEYQATRVKLRIAAIAPAADPAAAARYAAESVALRTRAEALHADYARAEYRDNQFDLGDGFASIALATAAIAALAESWWLLAFGWAAAALALLFDLAGFARLPLHPDLLIGWLT